VQLREDLRLSKKLQTMETFNDPWPSPPILDGLSTDQMDSLAELHEGAFEPQIRARSNTWPLPRPENFVEPNDDTDNNQQSSNQQSLTGKLMGFLSFCYCRWVGIIVVMEEVFTVSCRTVWPMV
jgi:hypothetical protein